MRARIWKVRCVVIRDWHVFAPTYPQLWDLLRKLPMLELASEKHAEKTYNDKEKPATPDPKPDLFQIR